VPVIFFTARDGEVEVMNKLALLLGIASALALAPNQASALRATELPRRLSHNIPAAQTYCLIERFRQEGLDSDLQRSFAIKAEDAPQALALRRYCQSRQPAGDLPGLYAPGDKLGRYRALPIGLKHLFPLQRARI
jgi:hypothetical protein